MNIARGKIMWEYNLETKIFQEAEYEEVLHEGGIVERIIKKKKGHLYCNALNFANADRKFILMIKKLQEYLNKKQN